MNNDNIHDITNLFLTSSDKGKEIAFRYIAICLKDKTKADKITQLMINGHTDEGIEMIRSTDLYERGDEHDRT